MQIKSKLLKLKESKIWDWFNQNPQFLTLGFIFFLAFFFRLWKIGEIPGGFSAKEAATLDTILRVEWSHLWLGSKFYHGFYTYLGGAWVAVFGETIANLRILSALIGSFTVVLMYFFVSKWFTKKIALFSTFLFAISSFHIGISRVILPEVTLPLIIFALFLTLTIAYRDKNPWYFGASGLLTGLGLLTSPIFLLIPVLFVISAAYFFYKNKKFITYYQKEIGIFGLGFLATSLPYWVSFVQNPMSYLTFFGFNRSFWQVIMNIGQVPTIIFSGTSREFFINLGTEPLVDPFIFITFVFGFVLVLFSIQRRKYFFLILWLFLFSFYAALKRGVTIVDLIGIIPIVYILSGIVIDYVLDRWFQTFPTNKAARMMALGLVSVFLALSALYNYDKYFIAYGNSRSVIVEFSAEAPIPLK